MPAPFWAKKNKAAEKWTEKEVVKIFEDTAAWIEENEDIMLIVDVDIYMLRHKSVSQQLRSVWLNKLYNNNRCICALWEYIKKVTESRVTKDKEKILRPNIQALVLQTKHGYRERSTNDTNHTFSKIPTIKKNGKKVNYDVGSQID